MADKRSYFRFPLLVALWMVTLMSGILSLYRELYGLYSGTIPPRSIFWSCMYVAFIISAVILWCLEHYAVLAEREKVKEAEKKLGRPELTASCTVFNSNGYNLFVFINHSNVVAVHVEVQDITNGGKTLRFRPMDFVRKETPRAPEAYIVGEESSGTGSPVPMGRDFFGYGWDGFSEWSRDYEFSATYFNLDDEKHRRQWQLSCNFKYNYRKHSIEMERQGIEEIPRQP